VTRSDVEQMNIETVGQHHPANVGGGPYAVPMSGASALKSDKELLNAYIYDYLVKHNLKESAKSFNREADVASFHRSPTSRTSTPKDDKLASAANGDHSPSIMVSYIYFAYETDPGSSEASPGRSEVTLTKIKRRQFLYNIW
jgi:hypothetical protein